MERGIDFDQLISPLTSSDIAACCDSGKPLFQSGNKHKFQALFSRAHLDKACNQSAGIHVTFASEGRESMSPLAPIDASEVDAYYKAGATVCISGINRTSPELNCLASACKIRLGWSGVVDCRAYLSNDGAGYTPHFDDKTVITFQVEGSKKWWVGDAPAIRNPVANAGRFPDGIYRYFRSAAEVKQWEEFAQPDFPNLATTYVLNPGDILIVPAGVWHTACAQGHSLSIALTLNHVGAGSTHDIIFSVLLQQLMFDHHWRGAVPMAPCHDRSDAFESLNKIDDFFIARLQVLRQWVDKNLDDRTDIIRAWARHLSQND